MPKHIVEEDLLVVIEDYVKKDGHTPNRIITTNKDGFVDIKSDLNVSQLDFLRNVTSDIQSQINSKSGVEHTHEEYLTLEELKDINFSGVAQDVSYNPENSNLESTNVKDALDEVDNKVEEYIDKLVADKSELKAEILETNKRVSDLGENTTNISIELSNKANVNHTHEGSDHNHEDLEVSIANNSISMSELRTEIAGINTSVDSFPDYYAKKTHSHSELQSQIDAISTDITDHRHQYLEDTITTVNEKANENKTNVTNIKKDIADISESLTNKANVDHTHDSSDHIHQDILDRIDLFNNDFVAVNEKIEDEAKRVDDTFSKKIHSHIEYAVAGHTHLGSEHDHNGVYAPNFHLHNNYADTEHYHNDLYAELVHNHNNEYSPATHTHGDLANKEHTHNEFSDFVLISDKNIANGIAGLDANSKLSLSVLPDTAKAVNIIGTQEDRLALAIVDVGTIFRETDTGDSYIYDGNDWVILANADWENVNLSWSNVIDKPSAFVPETHTHKVSELEDLDLSVYAEKVHTHNAQEVSFSDGETLQQKLDGGSLGGGSSSGGDCNLVISNTPPTGLPIGGIWIDTSSL